MIRIFMIGISTNKGGVEAYITNLCSQLREDEFEIVHCWPEIVLDGKVWKCPPNRHNYLAYRSFWRRFYKENRFDAVYLNTCDIVSIDQLKFAKEAGVPVRIIHSHSAGNQQALAGRMHFFHRFAEKRNRKTLDQYATDLFACSEAAGDWMFDGRPYTVIQNGIELGKYRFSPENRKKCRAQLPAADGVLIGCIGRLSPEKNPRFNLQIIEEALRLDPSVRLVMLGDGELREEVQMAIAEKGLDEKVYLLGAVDNVYQWLSAIDCLVMPSIFEGLPFVLVEAQATGIPCVVSSAVSPEADLTGLIHYISLEESPAVWAETILNSVTAVRPDTTAQLTEAGFSVENTAQRVSWIIQESQKRNI